jgi:hypothetical protein
MPGFIRCPNCKKQLPATERHLGRKCMCPKCNTVFVCPDGGAGLAGPSRNGIGPSSHAGTPGRKDALRETFLLPGAAKARRRRTWLWSGMAGLALLAVLVLLRLALVG